MNFLKLHNNNKRELECERKYTLGPAEILLLNIIRIEITTPTGIGTETGFIFNFTNNEQIGEHILVIVTNKPVLAGAITGKLHSFFARMVLNNNG